MCYRVCCNATCIDCVLWKLHVCVSGSYGNLEFETLVAGLLGLKEALLSKSSGPSAA